jgi:glycosyltransferase involved in cell wall biosynthesis
MSHTTPFFSICIPNFNYAGYIEQTIESVLQQDFHDFEIIISDNASTDQSWAVIQHYVAKDSRIRAFQNTFNVGFAGNLQKASEQATGKYIIMLSSDDLMNEGALTKYHQTIQKLSSLSTQLVLHSAYDVIDQENKLNKIHYRFPIKNKGAWTHDDYFHDEMKEEEIFLNLNEFNINEDVICEGADVFKEGLFDTRSPAAFLTTCYSRSLWLQVEGYDLTYTYMPDYVFLLKILSLQPKVIYCRPRLFSYRIHNANQNAIQKSQMSIKKYVDEYMLTIQFPEYLLNKNNIYRIQLVDYTLTHKWLNWSIRHFRFTSFQEGFRLWMFCYATYPWVVIKKIDNLKVLAWALTSPINLILFRLYKHLKY